jgi:hypothetical protein
MAEQKTESAKRGRTVIQLFLGFAGLGFAADCRVLGGVSGAALGRGLPLGASRISSISLSRYNPAEPIYRKGFIPFFWNLFFTASDDIPSSWAISTTGFSSMNSIIHINLSSKQVKNDINSRNKAYFSKIQSKRYSGCIKTIQIKFLNFFEKNLDRPIGLGVYFLMFPTLGN